MPVEGYGVRVEAQLANGEVATCTLRYAIPPLGGAFALTEAEQQVIVDDAQAAIVLGALRDVYATDMGLGPVSMAHFTVVPPAVGPPPYTGYIDEDPARVFTDTPVASGQIAGQSSPPQVAVVQSLKASGAGRRGIGRLFTFPPPESVVGGDGLITDAAARNTSWKDFEDVVTASVQAVEPTARLVVVSANYDEVNEVTARSMNARVDTQRRRLQR